MKSMASLFRLGTETGLCTKSRFFDQQVPGFFTDALITSSQLVKALCKLQKLKTHTDKVDKYIRAEYNEPVINEMLHIMAQRTAFMMDVVLRENGVAGDFWSYCAAKSGYTYTKENFNEVICKSKVNVFCEQREHPTQITIVYNGDVGAEIGVRVKIKEAGKICKDKAFYDLVMRKIGIGSDFS